MIHVDAGASFKYESTEAECDSEIRLENGKVVKFKDGQEQKPEALDSSGGIEHLGSLENIKLVDIPKWPSSFTFVIDAASRGTFTIEGSMYIHSNEEPAPASNWGTHGELAGEEKEGSPKNNEAANEEPPAA